MDTPNESTVRGGSTAHRTSGVCLLVVVAFLLSSFAAADVYRLDLESELGLRLSNLPENSWVQVNVNEFRDVWTPLDQRPKPPEAPSVGGPWSIIEAWSSMAWDGNRGSLIFWGGGHANYPGNDVYRWVGSTMRWERASLPSEVALAKPTVLFEAVDGPFNAPIAAHTYDAQEFLPLSDRFITFGGAAFNTGHYFELVDGRRTGPYLWDPSRSHPNAVGGSENSQVKPLVYNGVIAGHMWENRDNLEPPSPDEPRPGYSGTFMINAATAYAEEGGKDTLYIQASAELFRYTIHSLADAASDTYERVGRYIRFPFTGQGAAGYDPVRKIFLRTADETITYWTLDAPGDGNENRIVSPVVLAGSFPWSQLRQFGLDFDPVRRAFVLWNGQSEVWQLRAPSDLGAGTWTIQPLTPSSPTYPSLTTSHTGILGKWKYAAALDVFLGAIDAYEGQIWAYKPTNWQPQVAVPLPFVVAPRSGSVFAGGMDISVTVDSTDKTVSNLDVYANGALIGAGSSVPYTLDWGNVAAGSYVLTVAATGEDAVRRVSPGISITVIGGSSNLPPTVELTAPTNGASYPAGSSVTMSAAAADVDGSVVRVEFFSDGVRLGEDVSAPYSFTWAAPPPGGHVLTAVATDDDLASAVSPPVDVTIGSPAPPTVTLEATPAIVAAGGSSGLTWEGTGVTSCVASGGWSGARSLSGVESVGPIAATTSYTLSCTGAGGSASATVVVAVAPEPTLTLGADRTSVVAGETLTLTWSSTNATACTAGGAWSGSLPTLGSRSAGPVLETSTYRLTCSGAGGSVTEQVTVTVTAGEPPRDRNRGGGGALSPMLLAGLASLLGRCCRRGN